MTIVHIPDNELDLAFETMVQLREHLKKEEFEEILLKMKEKGYHLVGIKENGIYVALAGYRYNYFLAYGDFLYCDDLIVHDQYRKKGYGDMLMEFLYKEAQNNQCKSFQLDSATFRFWAHHLYIKHFMRIGSYHFIKEC